MHRRTFVRVTAAAAASPFVGGCEDWFAPPEPETSTAEVDMSTLAQAVQPQRCQLWCWAASISMIFGYHGRPVSQERIVVDTYGAVVCLPSGNAFTIGANLSRGYLDDFGRPFFSQVHSGYDPENGVYSLTNAIIVNELRNNGPLLYCNRSHAMVLYSVDYTGTASAPNIVAARVVDPWPASPRFHPLLPSELYARELGGDMTFLAAVNVT